MANKVTGAQRERLYRQAAGLVATGTEWERAAEVLRVAAQVSRQRAEHAVAKVRAHTNRPEGT